MLDVVIFGLLGFVVVSAAIVPLSLLVEEMRPLPPTPERLSWAPDIPIRYVSVNGVRLRYIKTGEGPALVLLHTLRTQLDLFEKVVPELAKSFTVYAVDYPGHGYSDIPAAKYDADYFVETIESFLEALDLHDSNAETWETATKAYSNIRIPVLLLWGARDWSRPDEREHDRQIVPSVKMATVEDGGHFLPLDRPDAVIEHLLAFQAPLVGKASS
jgi:pimeloyl-ACP methyl ester carboxylesterase